MEAALDISSGLCRGWDILALLDALRLPTLIEKQLAATQGFHESPFFTFDEIEIPTKF
jgi:hypothetical protein